LISLLQNNFLYYHGRLLYLLKQQLTSSERKLVTNFCRKYPQIKIAYGLATQFKQMMENKQGYCLQSWMGQAIHSCITELRSFAVGLKSDIKTLKKAFTQSWNNVQVKGQINKLKTTKRLIY
jgi:transposase